MEGPISFWGYKEQETNLILPEHDDDDDDKFPIQNSIQFDSHRRTAGSCLNNLVCHVRPLTWELYF